MSDLWENEEEPEEIAPRPVRRMRRSRSARNEQRGNLYLLTGLLIGAALGLVYAWLISPVRYVDTEPNSLAAPYKDEYRQVIALAYAANHDLGRARDRLALLDSGSPIQGLAALAQRRMAENQPQEAKALALLAANLNRPPSSTGIATGEMHQTALPAVTPSPQAEATRIITSSPAAATASSQETLTQAAPAETTNTPEIPAAVQSPTLPLPTRTATPSPVITGTNTPTATSTPRPTATPLPTLDAPFALKSQRQLCDGSIPPGQMQFLVTDASGKPLPGVRILVTWKGGEDFFYTGLAPEISPGYADFTMQADVSYRINVGQVSQPVDVSPVKQGCGMQFQFIQQKNSGNEVPEQIAISVKNQTGP